MKHFNKLTPAQAERLAILSEELGECQQAIGKILRHGYDSYNPMTLAGPSNREHLACECGDVRAAIVMLCDAEDIPALTVIEAQRRKLVKVVSWMHHREET